MQTLPLSATDETLLNVVREWVELLAREHYGEAYAMTYHAPDDHWTPDLMKTVITHYGFIEPRRDGKTFKVTSLHDSALRDGTPTHQDVMWFDPHGYRGWLHFTMPLNHEWSDVTAIFSLEVLNGQRILILEDIHVLGLPVIDIEKVNNQRAAANRWRQWFRSPTIPHWCWHGS